MSNMIVEYIDYDRREISKVTIPIAEEQYKTLIPMEEKYVVDGNELTRRFIRTEIHDERMFDYVLTQDIDTKELKELIAILQHLSRQTYQ